MSASRSTTAKRAGTKKTTAKRGTGTRGRTATPAKRVAETGRKAAKRVQRVASGIGQQAMEGVERLGDMASTLVEKVTPTQRKRR